MTPAGTRVTWFVLGVCVGVLLAVVGMAGIAEAASSGASEPPSTAPALRGAPLGDQGTGEHNAGVSQARLPSEGKEVSSPATESGAPLTAKVGSALYSGTATWCAPTPKYCQSWGNGRLLGAVNAFRWGDEPYRVRVSRGDRSVVVRVVSFCACENRADKIDLSPAAAKAIEPDWRRLGRFAVEVEVLR